MRKITDEILNRYLDGELNEIDSAEIRDTINSSEEVKKRYKALSSVHDSLKSLEPDKTSKNFKEKVMNRLKSRTVVPKQQKYFILSMVVISSVLCLIILGFVIGTVLASAPASPGPATTIEAVDKFSDSLIYYVNDIFSGRSLSIIGAVFSLLIIITGYFFFENQKKAKVNLSCL